MKADRLEAAWRIWEKSYPDIPWVRRNLRIDPSRVESGGTFQFLIDGGCGQYAITPMTPGLGGQDTQPVPEGGYSLTMADDDSGIVLRVDPAWPVDHVVIQQLGDSPSMARVACLWLDSAAGQWVVIYNVFDRQKALLNSIAGTIGVYESPFVDHLLAFLQHLMDGKAAKALGVYEGSTQLRDWSAQLQKACERFELQINAHGLKRTFRFWTASEKKAYLEGTQALMVSLSGLSAHVCLGFGAVLGWVRDQDLIAHDDDLDIIAAFDACEVKDLGSALELTRRALEDQGHQVLGTFFSHLWVRTPGGHRADVFVGLIEEGGALSFYPSARRSLRLADIAPVAQASLYGVSIPVPADCESYLERTYGQGWRQPDIRFAHPWDRLSYDDIAGQRSKPVMWTRGELAHRNRAHRLAA
jgi:hypothetical protein